jgi:hypothetical protein
MVFDQLMRLGRSRSRVHAACRAAAACPAVDVRRRLRGARRGALTVACRARRGALTVASRARRGAVAAAWAGLGQARSRALPEGPLAWGLWPQDAGPSKGVSPLQQGCLCRFSICRAEARRPLKRPESSVPVPSPRRGAGLAALRARRVNAPRRARPRRPRPRLAEPDSQPSTRLAEPDADGSVIAVIRDESAGREASRRARRARAG